MTGPRRPLAAAGRTRPPSSSRPGGAPCASVDDLLERARRRIRRVGPHELAGIARAGGLVVDIRPSAQRAEEGELPGAVVVERNVLEWRLDPGGAHRLAEVRGRDQPVVVVCSAGYASSLAAATLVDLGYVQAADLIGGYRAWSSWFGHHPAAAPAPTGVACPPGPGSGAGHGAVGDDRWRQEGPSAVASSR